jgi:hypothetical protein
MNLFNISLEQLFKQVYNFIVIVPFIDPDFFRGRLQQIRKNFSIARMQNHVAN